MDELEDALVWSTTSTEESRLFYASSIKNLAKKYSSRTEEDLAGEVIAQVFKILKRAIDRYGHDGEEEEIVVRCQLPKETGGIWAFDVRFKISGKSLQVLSAARTIREISEALTKEINGVIRDSSNQNR
jgi:hypothetical protein